LRPCFGFLLVGLVLRCSVFEQLWLVDLLVFGGSLVDVTMMFCMVVGTISYVVAHVVICQAWHASSTATMMEGAGCGGVYF
jgi:hypothetical protein